MLEDLKPKQVFHYFEELTKIPRCSGNEQQVSDYLVSFAKERKLAVFQDPALNVIIKKPGTTGYEKSPAVIIQGHMDMVCEKTKKSNHDFAKDPLRLIIEKDILRADGTTLGSDNGIAVAYALALLDASDIPHPPLEILITTSEETGMKGAFALKADHLSGTMLLNIDAEEEGVFLVSCAGGLNFIAEFDTQWEKADAAGLLVEVSGLQGGHSGLEIIKQRANALKLLGRLLQAARETGDFHLAAISGGAKSNAIPREAQAVLTGSAAALKKIKTAVAALAKDLQAETAAVDPDLRVKLSAANKTTRQLDRISTDRIIDFLVIAPTGVQSMSQELDDLVESSLNLGVLEQADDTIKVTISIRSSVKSLKNKIIQQIAVLSGLVNAKYSITGDYPAWHYNPESSIRDLCTSVYQDVSGHKAKIQAIHAGLECGLLTEKLPGTDMISFGPNLYDVHTPDEHLSISSVASIWTFLTALLAKLK